MSVRPSPRIPAVLRFQGNNLSPAAAGGTAVKSPSVLPIPLETPESDGSPVTTPPAAPAQAETAPAKPVSTRLSSLDAFRGLTILGMLLVNNIALGEKTPKSLMHAEWSGEIHFADFVAPWFLFIVGVALPYAQASARRRHVDAWEFDLKALWRAAALVGLGCLIDSFIAHRPVFDLGVLQLIGMGYFTAVLGGGLFNLPGRVVLAFVLLGAHWALIKLTPVPGVGAGTFTEDNNVIKWLNEDYLAQYNLQGLFSILPATAMVLIGSSAGDFLRRKKVVPMGKAAVLAICGAGLISLGVILSHKGIAPYDLPMNKPCWTAPYIFYTGGWACVGLTLMYLLVDTTPGKWGRMLVFPLIVAGMNAIVAYVLPILTKVAILRNITSDWPTGKPLNVEDGIHQWFYEQFGRIHGGWTYTLTYIVVWWCVLLFLYKKRWFLKV